MPKGEARARGSWRRKRRCREHVKTEKLGRRSEGGRAHGPQRQDPKPMAGCLSWTDVGALVVSEQQASHACPPQDFVFTPSSPSIQTTQCIISPTATTDLTYYTPQSTTTHRLPSSARLPESHQAVPASQTILHVRRPSHDSCEPHPIYPLSSPRSTSSSPPTWRTPRRTSNRPHPRLRGREVCCELTPPR